MGFTKLFSLILTSSIWCEDHPTVRVWIGMLALANANGVVEASIPGLANVCRVTMAECQKALDLLSAPDPYSRNPADKGRRIRPCEGGWIIINHDHYRQKRDEETRRKQTREAMARYRQRIKNENVDVSQCEPNVSHCEPTGEPKTEDRRQKTDKRINTLALSARWSNNFFEKFWNAYPKKRSKGQAEKAWAKIHPDERLLEKILSTIDRAKKSDDWIKEAGQFIPYPATWLNSKGWEDEIKDEKENWHEKVRSIK